MQENYSGTSFNTLKSFETEGLPSDFFVDNSVKDRQDSNDDNIDSFPIHRRLLRRRHVRKLQKSKERERQRKEEERKLKELTRDRDRKRRAEKTRALRDNEMASKAKLRAKRTVHSRGIDESPVREGYYSEGYFVEGTTKKNRNAMPYCVSPTSVMGLHRMMVSSPTLASPHPIVSDHSTGHIKIDTRGRSSFSLPEFTPVRPTKFRKLRL